jgi:hypothetical protein
VPNYGSPLLACDIIAAVAKKLTVRLRSFDRFYPLLSGVAEVQSGENPRNSFFSAAWEKLVYWRNTPDGSDIAARGSVKLQLLKLM